MRPAGELLRVTESRVTCRPLFLFLGGLIVFYSESILAAARHAVEQHPGDIQEAVDCAEKLIRALPEFRLQIDLFVRSSVQDLVYRSRSLSNAKVRMGCADHAGRPKVIVGHSQGVKDAYAEYYGYFVAGKTLGNILGEELLPLADAEQGTGEGFLYRARLLRLLSPLVAKGKTVRQCVRGPRIASVFAEAESAGK